MTKKLLIFFLALGILASCKKKDPEPTGSTGTTVNTADPNAVSSSLTIKNAEKLKGVPPSPTNSPEAPVLSDQSSETLKANANKTLALSISTESGTAAGAYVQVKGSDEYYKVTVNSGLKKGRKGNATRIATSSSSYLPITLPANISPGTFCFQYCVFDSLGRISNIIEKCVEVVTLGGSNADFLFANGWELYKYKYYDSSGYVEESFLGNDTSYYTTYVPCSTDSLGGKSVEVYSIYNTTKMDMIFQNDGAGKYSYASTNTYYDYASSSCDNIVYMTEIENDEYILGWTYDDQTKKLILVFDFEEGEEPEALEMTVTLENNEMRWYDSVLDETYYLRKK